MKLCSRELQNTPPRCPGCDIAMSTSWQPGSRPSHPTRGSRRSTTPRTSGFSWSNTCRRETLGYTSVRFPPSHLNHIPSLSTLLVRTNNCRTLLTDFSCQFLTWGFTGLQTFTSTEGPPSTWLASSHTLPSLRPTSSGTSMTTSWPTTHRGDHLNMELQS